MVDEPRGFNADWNPPQEPGVDPIPLGDQAPTVTHGVPEDSLPPPIKAGDGVSVFYDGYAYVLSIDREDLYAYPWPDSVGWTQINAEVEAMIRDFSWDSLTGVPLTFPATPHTHTISQITDFPATWAWTAIAGKPSTFPPDPHTHGTTGIDDNSITNGKLRDSVGLSVIGRTANTTGDPADIAAGTDGHVLRRSGTAIGFGEVATAGIANDAVTNVKLANMATATIKGRNTAGTGDPEDLSAATVKTLLAIGIADVSGLTAALAAKLSDAPSDGDTYGRKNGAWVKAAGAAQIQDAAPATGDVGTFWWSSLTGQLAIRYNDGNTTQWVGLNAALSSAVTISDAAPTTAYPGLLWWSSLTGELSIRYNDGDSEQWVSAFGGGNLPFRGARVTNGATQSLANTVAAAINFNTEYFDTSGFHDNAINNTRLTIPAGVSFVELTAAAVFASSVTGNRYIDIIMNGSDIVCKARYIPTDLSELIITSGPIAVVPGDYFEFRMYHSSGAALNTGLGCWFAIKVLG